MKKILLLGFIVLFIFNSTGVVIPESYSQSSSMKTVCPTGTTAKIVGLDIECISNNIPLKCPSGYYIGLDNSGKSACRNIETNEIMGLEKKSNPTVINAQKPKTNPQLPESEILFYFLLVLVFFLFILFILIYASPGKKSRRRKYGKRRSFPEETRIATLRYQGYCCNSCHAPFQRISSGLGYLCDFDHIDGRSDNSFENCQALCPNCHARKTREG